MSQLDNLRRLTEEGNFNDEQRQVIGYIASSFNHHIEQIINVVNGNLDFTNLKSKLVQFEVTVDSNGVPTTKTQFRSSVGAIGSQTISALNLTNAAIYPTSAPFVTFSSLGTGGYEIKHVAGLQANNKYQIILKLEFS